MSESKFQSLDGLPWSEARLVDTRAGKRLVQNAILNGPSAQVFWEDWRENKAELKASGIAVSKTDKGEWQVSCWTMPDGGQTSDAKRRAEEESAPDALPADWIPDDVTLTAEQSSHLLHYQGPAALRLKRALTHGNALDASDTGTGKTFVALAAAAELGLVPCVIAPLAVLPSWRRAASLMGVRLGWVINYDKIRTGRTQLGKWDGEQFKLTYLPPSPILIFDECHKAKSPDTLQGKLLRSIARDNKVLCLSATAAKDPMEMRNLGFALRLHDGTTKGFRAFCIANGCYDGAMGIFFTGGRQALEKLHRQIFPLKGNRIRIADLPEFPETTIHAETLECDTDAISAAYETAEAKIADLAGDLTLTAAERRAEGMASLMAARIAAEQGKLRLFCDLATDAVEEGRSVVIFLNFRDHIQQVQDALKTSCVVWGGQTPEARQANIDAFNADEERVIVISLQAGGAGLSLHDLNGNFPRLALISPSFSAVDLKQALGRVHRAGAKTKSQQRIIFAADTVEESICASVAAKLENIDSLNDGHLAPNSFLNDI